jgi:TRAP transporter 4TM/12TM fusion protein
MRRRLIITVAAGTALFHLFAAGYSPFTALVQRPVHLALMACLGFLGVGIRRSRIATEDGQVPSRYGGGLADRLGTWTGYALAATAVASAFYLAANHEQLVRRAASPTGIDLLLGVLTIVVVLELARRSTGWGLVSVAGLALTYAFVGPYLPGLLAHRGYGPTRLVEHLYLSTEGIWGIPLGVSADFVYLFILFGAILDAAGGGALLLGLASRLAGNTRGGPAKTAALSSAFMGSLSGSAVANVVTTGTFTIPIMKRAGFKPHFAAGVEAAASTGGQLMPPIMGAGAFILATWTQVPYIEVALAATIPAILYYVALVAAIHFRAGRMGIGPSSLDKLEPVRARLHLLLPLLVIVVMLAMGRSPMRAAFWGVTGGFAVALIRPATRLRWEDVQRALLSAGSGTVQVAAACAAAGIVVGVASLTGIGLRMSELIVTLAGGRLFPALVLTALGSIVLGMGLPTTAAYVVLAALGAPALVELGVPLLAAHLFIFYFGVISNVTPPVSLAAYAASGIAGASAMRSSITAMVLALAGFLVPFLFVYGPPLLLIGNVFEVALAVATGSVGVVALAAATMGYSRRRLGTLARIALGAASITLIAPGIMTDVLGTVVVLLFFLKTESEALPAPAEVAVERVDPSTPLAAASLLTPGESFQE